MNSILKAMLKSGLFEVKGRSAYSSSLGDYYKTMVRLTTAQGVVVSFILGEVSAVVRRPGFMGMGYMSLHDAAINACPEFKAYLEAQRLQKELPKAKGTSPASRKVRL